MAEQKEGREGKKKLRFALVGLVLFAVAMLLAPRYVELFGVRLHNFCAVLSVVLGVLALRRNDEPRWLAWTAIILPPVVVVGLYVLILTLWALAV